jgi:hypothetical protein
MQSRVRVVLGVVAVVETEHVVDAPVVARHATRMFIVPLQRAQSET